MKWMTLVLVMITFAGYKPMARPGVVPWADM
jgi:hypothetical protein